MKKHGYEVTGTRPVCVDFPDGRAVSYRPGMRFRASPHNASVRRLVRTKAVRQLGPHEPVPVQVVKLGTPHKEAQILATRKKIAAAKNLAQMKLEASKKAPPTVEQPKPAPAPKTDKS